MFREVAEGVGVVPFHPVTEADGLFCLSGGEVEDTAFASFDEFFDAVLNDGILGLEAEFALDLNFDPEALTVEAVLIPEIVSGHGEVALVGVLIGSAPGVMDSHGVVGGDGTVEKAPAFLSCVLAAQLVEDVAFFPELEDPMFAVDEIGVGGDFFKRGYLIGHDREFFSEGLVNRNNEWGGSETEFRFVPEFGG